MEKPTVVIIEDSSYLADSLVDMLEMHNYRALHCPTGREGVAVTLEQQPDLVLLDIRLPDITGYDVYHQIRATSPL